MENNFTELFFAPHCDDEALFGAITIMRQKPFVIVVSDSWIQRERGEPITCGQRREETKSAMDLLGVECSFLGLRDSEVSYDMILSAFYTIKNENKNISRVYAPMIEEGNLLHDFVAMAAREVFDNVIFYSTYTKKRPYPLAEIEIRPNKSERDLKNYILEFYHTQKNHKNNSVYFKHAKKRSEYLSNTPFFGVPICKEKQEICQTKNPVPMWEY